MLHAPLLVGHEGVVWSLQRCLEAAWAPDWTVTCVGDDLNAAPFPGSTAQALLLVGCPAPGSSEFVQVFETTLAVAEPRQAPCWGPWTAVASGPTITIRFTTNMGLGHLPPTTSPWTTSVRIVVLCSEGCPETRAVFVLEPSRAPPGRRPPSALVDLARAVACNACRLARGSTWAPGAAAAMPTAREGADTLQSWLQRGVRGHHAFPPGLAVRYVAKAPACTGKFASWVHAWWGARQQHGEHLGTQTKGVETPTARALVVVGGVGALATRASQLQAWLPEAHVMVIATKAHLAKATWAALLAADFVLTTSVFLASAANATHLAHVGRQLVACAAAPRNRGGHRLLADADLVQVFDPKLTVVDDDGCSGTNFFLQAAASAPVLQAAARGLRDVIQATDDGRAPPPPWYDFRGPVLHLVPWTAIVGVSLPCKDPLATMATLAAVTDAGAGAPPPTSRCFLVETRDVDHDCIVGQSVRCRVRGEGQDAAAVAQWRPTAILTNRAPLVPASHHVVLAPSTAELEAIRDNSGWAAFMGSWLAWEASAHVTQLWTRLGFEPVPTDEAVDAVLNLHAPRLQQVSRYITLCKPRQVWVLEPKQRPDVWCALDVQQPQGPVGLYVPPPSALLPLPTQPPPPLPSAGRPAAWVQALEQAQCMLQRATEVGLEDEQEEVSRQWSRLHGVLSTAAHDAGLASVAGDPAFQVFTLASAADELRRLVHECVAQEARMRAVALGDVCPLCCHRPCATLFPCGHMACVDCTVTWRRSQPGCYVCRQPCRQVFVLSGAQGPGGAAAAAALPPLSMCPRLPWFALPTDWPPDSWIGQQWARACLRGGGGGPAFSSLAFWVACVLLGHQPVPDPARAPDPAASAAPTVVLVHTPSHGHALGKALTRIHNGSDRDDGGDGDGDARPLVMFKGSVEERMALQASFQTGNCHLCVVVSDVAAGVKVAGVHTLLAMVPTTSLQPSVLRALRPSGAVITMAR
jgi:hypothetical protein